MLSSQAYTFDTQAPVFYIFNLNGNFYHEVFLPDGETGTHTCDLGP